MGRAAVARLFAMYQWYSRIKPAAANETTMGTATPSPPPGTTMIEVHHLSESRSRRITWLLEELGEDYTVTQYQRNPQTRLAPPELMAVHPLGKAPVLRDGEQVLIESGAIIDYLVRNYGKGRFAPAMDSPAYNRYVQFLHYGEGSAMLPLLLKLYVGRLGDAGWRFLLIWHLFFEKLERSRVCPSKHKRELTQHFER